MKTRLRLSDIKLDDRAQPRAAISTDRVAEYVEDMARGDDFPPPIVFRDKDDNHWLADGFHRYHAAVGIEAKSLECDVRRGDLRDAILYSCSANAEHGLRRTNADKRAAVTKLLKDDEWKKWADREIARVCRVHHELVGKLRSELMPVTGGTASERTYRTKHGTTAKMKTGKLGKRKANQPDLPAQVQRDNDNGFISSALWEIERLIETLPPPAQAAERFPSHHRHTFTTAKLHKLASWISGFAEAWPTVGVSNGKTRSAA